MTITIGVQDLALLIAALAFVALVVALIPAIMQIRRTGRAVEEMSIEGRKALVGLNIVIGREVEVSKDIVELIKGFSNAGMKAVEFLEYFAGNLKSPFISILSVVLGLEEAFKGFIKDTTKKDEGGGDHDNHG